MAAGTQAAIRLPRQRDCPGSHIAAWVKISMQVAGPAAWAAEATWVAPWRCLGGGLPDGHQSRMAA